MPFLVDISGTRTLIRTVPNFPRNYLHENKNMKETNLFQDSLPLPLYSYTRLSISPVVFPITISFNFDGVTP